MKLEAFVWYIEENKADIEQGKPIIIQVVNRDIFEEKVVKAIVSKDPKVLPDGEDLWIKDEKEDIDPVPWKIKILEETGDLWTRPFRGLRTGG